MLVTQKFDKALFQPPLNAGFDRFSAYPGQEIKAPGDASNAEPSAGGIALAARRPIARLMHHNGANQRPGSADPHSAPAPVPPDDQNGCGSPIARRPGSG